MQIIMKKKQELTKNKINKNIFLLLLLILLFLRFPFLILIEFKKIPINISIGFSIFKNITYLITALIIILKRNSLSDYNIDFFALLVFMVAPFARLFTIPFSAINLNGKTINIIRQELLFQILISVFLGFVLLYYHPKLHKSTSKNYYFGYCLQ